MSAKEEVYECSEVSQYLIPRSVHYVCLIEWTKRHGIGISQFFIMLDWEA
jgi:hypothetical protein